ncbi:MAG: ribbon-helix-helix protein, CopG family [Treponema sp.]|jgi:Mn-dependent DtxR family transcriptional regulator|nr:ribbon-helix-helix protein, CopG family [Treponema sp.]
MAKKRQLKITFQVDEDMKEALEKEAIEFDSSMSWVIVRRLRKSLETDQRLPPKLVEKSQKTSSAGSSGI